MKQKIGIVGAGYTGLTLGYYLAKAGHEVTLFEKDNQVGGLAGTFKVGNTELEKFYHHWFTNDEHIMGLIKELGLEADIMIRPTRTGMYYANNFFKLSYPLDLLKFKPLPFISRIRLGFVVLAVRMVKDWRKLESKTAVEWLKGICGEKAYQVVWEPLLKGKFGRYAEQISAVWFWNKLKLRGGSRGEKGAENLAYFKGGFAQLANKVKEEINANGGIIHLNCGVEKVVENQTIYTENGEQIQFDKIILTAPLPIISKMIADIATPDYLTQINKINYIGNVCLVLQLDRSLSEIYWLNVNDPDFPFVGIIEHTNFEPTESYDGKHIVYMSKYLPTDEAMYKMADKAVLDYALPYIKRMFPKFEDDWITDYHVWREAYSQPLVEKHYSQLIPAWETPMDGVYINTMAQIYPEDRGTNYAVREGKKMAMEIIDGRL